MLYKLNFLYHSKTFIAQSNFCVLLLKFILTASLVLKEYTTTEVNLWYSTTTIFSLLLVVPNLTMGSFVRIITYTLNKKGIPIFEKNNNYSVQISIDSLNEIIDKFYYLMLTITFCACVLFFHLKISSEINFERKWLFFIFFILISIIAVVCHKYKCYMYAYKFVIDAIRIELIINLLCLLIILFMFALNCSLYLILIINISGISFVYLMYVIFCKRKKITFSCAKDKSLKSRIIIKSIVKSGYSNLLNNICLNIVPVMITFSCPSFQNNMFLFMNRLIQTISKSSNLFFSPYLPEITNLISLKKFLTVKKIIYKILVRISFYLFVVLTLTTFASYFKNKFNPLDSHYFDLNIFLFACALMYLDRIYNLAISVIYCSNNICFLNNLSLAVIAILVCCIFYSNISLYFLFVLQYFIKIIFLELKPFRLLQFNYNSSFTPPK